MHQMRARRGRILYRSVKERRRGTNSLLRVPGMQTYLVYQQLNQRLNKLELKYRLEWIDGLGCGSLLIQFYFLKNVMELRFGAVRG